MELKNKDKIDLKKYCPYVRNPPSKDCYNVKMDSQSIISILKYCAKDFSECRIYKKHSLQNK